MSLNEVLARPSWDNLYGGGEKRGGEGEPPDAVNHLVAGNITGEGCRKKKEGRNFQK